eukprot:7332829-Pyramimonas_sp.AAC.1
MSRLSALRRGLCWPRQKIAGPAGQSQRVLAGDTTTCRLSMLNRTPRTCNRPCDGLVLVGA